MIAFLAAALFLLYTIVLYPLLLHWLAQRGARPVRRGFYQPPVSVVLPVRNGERWIGRKLDCLLQQDYQHDLLQIFVVSDGSTDQTETIVSTYQDRGIELIRVPSGGKAMALNAGIQRCSGELIFFTDVRQDLDPDAISRLCSCFADPQVGVASGTLVIRKGETRELADTGLYWRYEIWIRHNLSRVDSIFGATGCIYMMRRALTVPLPADALLDDMHLPLAAFFRGYRLIVDEQAKAYDEPTVLNDEFRRKVRTLAGNYQILGAYPGLLTAQNRMWIHFVSSKFARLLLPFALIQLLLSSLWLPTPFGPLLFAGQALFYSAALVDRLIPDGSATKRITSPIRTFVVLMAAALCAASILVVPPQRLWSETRKH